MENLSLQDNVDQERRTRIESALQQYRETVSQHNVTLIRAYVRAVAAQPVPGNWSEDTAQTMRMRECSRALRIQFPESVSPQQLLDDDNVIAELVRTKYLEGVSSYPVNLEQREEYFAKVGTRVREIIDVAEFPPADLAYLCTLVSGITGPGLSYHHDAQVFDFISPIKHAQMVDEMAQAVIVPIRYDYSGSADQTTDQLTFVWEEWNIAVAFQIGSGPQTGGSFALYCRRVEANDEPFKWRYGIHVDHWGSEVYDSVEEFLGFYGHFKEQTEQDIVRDMRPVTGSGRGGRGTGGRGAGGM
ncbi:uncharacterized protein LY89DRAFT_685938 [Mollisia scopiformis]|uniref:Uncharacterized protein n=1 Tax=Mollisia scopiformis TaxID=149040 RepID=A0A194X4L0_MOLSC|nr:uncharacterized protein LY89DRAFT_685938 [Mollisia scopiformis]KUJ15118.1 hypothetical protein LY89DRAFT_685938 [Mollisia scopiformis]